ncbi:hypothetical protein DSM104299_00477 [Baekduia alba]|uniref:Zn-ribbon domain-containing OB-fold protein n=1 Tax=Baekduia alba TaxID=2997333 RepID=UPI0023410148|nr:OB-fold domain-containing protein [Baekduia alba]WCB91800.1 hypothetical protein DSM104299_00477 [Baekduia alba]
MSGLRLEDVVAQAPESARLWEALAERRLELPRCGACRRLRFPPLSTCPYCGSSDHAWEPVQARGTLYSWVVTHVAFDASLADDVPYVVGTVQLPDGPRIFARLEGVAPAALAPDMALEGVFGDEDGLPFLRFRPAGAR